MNIYSLKDLSKEDILKLLKRSNEFKAGAKPNLKGNIANIFLEPSTRTHASYLMAEKNSGLDVVEMDMANSSFKKGETLEDTLLNLEAVGIDNFVIRTTVEGYWNDFKYPHKVANAGDGRLNHPSQTLLDALTIYNQFGTLDGLKILIAGDTKYSRVFRSFQDLISKFDSEVQSFTPTTLGGKETDINSKIKDKDVVMMLRVQHERHEDKVSVDRYNEKFGLNAINVATMKENSIFMHPGPVNRDVEIASELLYDNEKKCNSRTSQKWRIHKNGDTGAPMQEYINGKVFLDSKFVQRDFLIKDGKILFNYDKTNSPVDLNGLYVTPGFVDIHVHTRTPGFEYKEEIDTVTEAALAGGFTTIVAMANINPAPTNSETFKKVLEATKTDKLNYLQAGRATSNGKPVDFKELSQFTNIFSDDGTPIDEVDVMTNVIKGVKSVEGVVLLHEEDHDLSGVGYNSKFLSDLNLPSFGPEYETSIVKRDIKLNEGINANIHLQHISIGETITLLNDAKAKGIVVTAELTPHHLWFNNEMLKNHGHFRMNPPIGSPEDQRLLQDAFLKDYVNIIATDHAPHAKEEKDVEFGKAANGIIGLETAFAAVNTLFDNELERIVKAMTINPAKLIGIDVSIKEGGDANINIIDPSKEWTFTEKDIKSKSKNSPWIGKTFKGKVIKTIYKNNERGEYAN